MQVVPSDGQICNYWKWCHLVAKFATYTSGAIWCPKNATNASGAMLLLNLIPSHGVNFWVRCASGNVYLWSTYFHSDIERGKNCTKMDTRPTSPDTEKEVNCKVIPPSHLLSGTFQWQIYPEWGCSCLVLVKIQMYKPDKGLPSNLISVSIFVFTKTRGDGKQKLILQARKCLHILILVSKQIVTK